MIWSKKNEQLNLPLNFRKVNCCCCVSQLFTFLQPSLRLPLWFLRQAMHSAKGRFQMLATVSTVYRPAATFGLSQAVPKGKATLCAEVSTVVSDKAASLLIIDLSDYTPSVSLKWSLWKRTDRSWKQLHTEAAGSSLASLSLARVWAHGSGCLFQYQVTHELCSSGAFIYS